MSHFAQINNNNTVIQVIVVHNNELLDNGIELETKGITFCKFLFGKDTCWVQTSYHSNFRKNYAGVGYTYDEQRDAFIAPKPEGENWVLNENTCQWEIPQIKEK